MKKLDKGRGAAMASCESGFEALQSMLKGEYTEESTGARTIRQTGGKDRHSKVFTARGPRDRRVRLSVATAIRFYDLQDRLGFEQPSKAVEWLLLHCQPSIQALPQLASLHPLHVTTISQPAAAYVDQHPNNQNKGQKTYETEQSLHQIQKEEKLSSYITDAVMHQIHNYTPHPQYDSPFPLGTDDHLQDSIEEDLSQYSNPSSSGASSDHPISCSEVARPACTNATLAEAIRPITANHTASSASVHQSTTSFAAVPSPAPIIHMNKRHRMQHYMQSEDGEDRLITSNASNGAAVAAASMSLPHLGRPLGNRNGLSSQLSCPASFGNTANFNRLMINDEDALLMSKFSLQDQLNIEDMQHIMRLPNLPSLANYKPSQYMDITQQIFTTQANQLAANDINLLQEACNHESSRKAEYINGQACTSNNSMLTMNNTMQLYNKIAALQQVDELVCSNVYASPSPSESTSINTQLAAAFNSKAGGNTNNNTLVDHDQAANILYRPDWNPHSGLQ